MPAGLYNSGLSPGVIKTPSENSTPYAPVPAEPTVQPGLFRTEEKVEEEDASSHPQRTLSNKPRHKNTQVQQLERVHCQQGPLSTPGATVRPQPGVSPLPMDGREEMEGSLAGTETGQG